MNYKALADAVMALGDGVERLANRMDAFGGSGDTGLWEYSPITGYWKLARTCSSENAQKWLQQFQSDEPQKKFKLSKNKPSGKS
jgi:hypothetical protein